MAGLSGLVTGLPPFMTAGSLVLLLGGADVLGTVSPMSCSEGSLYMATGKMVGNKNNEEDLLLLLVQRQHIPPKQAHQRAFRRFICLHKEFFSDDCSAVEWFYHEKNQKEFLCDSPSNGLGRK